jgi:serpin B
MKKILLILTLFLLTLGCVEQTSPTPPVNDTGATPEGTNSVVNANTQFALDLYSKFKDQEGNIFFSPYSISTALAMTYEGARGETASEMQSVLHIPADPGARRPPFASIYNDINAPVKSYTLSTANALWAQEGYEFLEDYTTTVETYYGGRVTNLDFAGNPEASRQTINSWVEDQTNDKIKDLIPQGALDSLTRLVLTNAIYFKGTWELQFDEANTRDEPFYTTPVQTVTASMMRLTGSDDAVFPYAEDGDNVQILELPYEGDDLSMLIILPEKGKPVPALTPEKLTDWRALLVEQRVDIYIPKFKFETKYFLADTLAGMGMPAAFAAGAADFSGMDGTRELFIQSVIHQAFVEVNEEGTEAAAATGVVVGLTAMPEEPVIPVFRADHPVLFIIQQKDTGNILFMGRVSDPTSG